MKNLAHGTVTAAFLAVSLIAGARAAAAAPALAAGDVGNCSVSTDTAVGNIIRGLPGTVLALGDLAYDRGTATEFQNCYAPAWGSFKSRTRPVPGNHEYGTSNASGYFGYFGAAAHKSTGGNYKFKIGTWDVIAYNTERQNLSWLRLQLANSAPCTLVYGHKPRRSGGTHGGVGAVDGAWQAMKAANVELYLAGHDHHYERFAPESGLVQFVVGTGGTPTRSVRATSGSQARLRSHGVLSLQLNSGGYTHVFRRVGGGTFDSGSGSCS